MVIGTNPNATPQEFEAVLEKGVQELTGIAEANYEYFMAQTSINFEKDVFEALKSSAKGTNFDNCIEQIGGHKFPDIIFKEKYYGVEVKSLKHDGWSTFGNSIFESTRPDNVDRIYLLAGRLSSPVEFRFKNYEECIDDIQVTHSPRYHIDMDTQRGETIFEKMGIPYEKFRDLPDLLKPIREFYKLKLKPGESLWWLENENDISVGSRLAVGFFNDLSKDHQESLKIRALARFPKLFSGNKEKYKKLASWLVAEHGLALFNARDFFTAGGQKKIMVAGKTYEDVPKIFWQLKGKLERIKLEIEKLPADVILENWGFEDTYSVDRFSKWVELIEAYSKKQLKESGFPLRRMIAHELNIKI